MSNGQSRLLALRQTEILDTPREPAFDDLAFLAAELAQLPMAFISFIDETRVWYKAGFGWTQREAPSENALCQLTLGKNQSPFTWQGSAAEHSIGYYVAFPLLSKAGDHLGNLCVAGPSFKPLSLHQLRGLAAIASQIHLLIEHRILAHGQLRDQRATLELQQRADAVLKNAPILLWAVDRQGYFTFYEGKAQVALGVRAQDRLGQNILTLFADRPEIAGNTQRALRGETVRDEAKLGNVWVENTFVPLFDQNQQINGVVGLSIDITSRKRDELERKKSEEIFQKARFGIAITSTQGEILQANPTFAEMHGYPAEELAGRPLDDLFADKPKANVLSFADTEPNKGHRSQENTHLRKDGTLFPVRLDLSAIKNERGEVLYRIAMVVDLSATKLAEKERADSLVKVQTAMEASRMKSEFLANMSHEIRTPIHGIIGMARLLEDSNLSSVQREYLQAVLTSSSSLLTVVNDVLDFSKIEAGKLDLEIIDFDLWILLHEIDSALGVVARSKGLILRLEIDADVPRALKSDPGRIRQIFNNLVSNAIKFTPRGEIVIQAAVKDLTADRARLIFKVRDTGIGIAQNALEKIFQAFSQADSSTTRKFGGTGLGLSICKHLVHQFHGDIGVESVEAQGTVFWFTVDLPLGMAVSQRPSRAPLDAFTQRTWTPRILIAEDNTINQIIALKLMEKMGLPARAVANGREVLLALDREHYDLILMDCQMPDLDGYQTTRQIRANKGSPYHNIAIVAMTANAIKGDREKCINVGMNEYVSKPVEPEALTRAIFNCLAPEKVKKMSVDLAPRSEAQLVDSASLEALREMDPNGKLDLLAKLIGIFSEETPQRVERIRQAMAAGDSDQASNEAHQIKSTSASLGAQSLAALAEQIERQAQENRWNHIPELLIQIEELLAAVLRELHAAIHP